MLEKIFTWKVCLIVLVFIIFIIYLIWGGNRTYEVEGLRFLDVNYDDGYRPYHLSHYDVVHRQREVRPPTPPREVRPPTPPREIRPPTPPLVSEVIQPLPVHEEPPPPYEPVFNVPYGSKGEEYTCRALGTLLQSEIINGARLPELTNPNTGRRLEIDCWCPEYRIGAEYDGPQHRMHVVNLQPRYEDFVTQVINDRIKDRLCKDNNIKLIRVPDTIDTHNFTINGLRPNKKFTPIQRYKRIKDYLEHHLPYISAHDQYNPNPHYTTSYIN